MKSLMHVLKEIIFQIVIAEIIFGHRKAPALSSDGLGRATILWSKFAKSNSLS